MWPRARPTSWAPRALPSISDSLKNAEAKASDAEAKIQDASAVLTLVTCDDAFLAKTKRAAMVCTLVGEVDTENADAASE